MICNMYVVDIQLPLLKKRVENTSLKGRKKFIEYPSKIINFIFIWNQSSFGNIFLVAVGEARNHCTT